MSFVLSVLVVLTTRWHGVLSLDASHGVQKLHAHPTPRVGGLPMVLGLIAAVAVSPAELRDKLWPWLLAGSPAFAFGLAEDLTKRVGVLARLLATMASGVLAWAITGYALTSVNVWGVDYVLQFTAVAVVFTAFAVGGGGQRHQHHRRAQWPGQQHGAVGLAGHCRAGRQLGRHGAGGHLSHHCGLRVGLFCGQLAVRQTVFGRRWVVFFGVFAGLGLCAAG